MTVRKGIPRLGKHRKEPDFETIVPKLRGACLVAASCVSFASARWRKLTRSAAAPLPTKSDDFAGAPVGNTPQEWGRKSFRGERQRKAKWRERMRDNPYKDLPPLERRPDGSCICRHILLRTSFIKGTYSQSCFYEFSLDSHQTFQTYGSLFRNGTMYRIPVCLP